MQTDTTKNTALKLQIRTIRQYIILLIIICIASLATLPVTSIFSTAQATTPASSINTDEPPYHWEACSAWTERELYLEIANHACIPSAKKHQNKQM